MFTKQDIFRQLEQMNAPRDKVVLMHTALRCVGQVAGGGQGLLDAMIEYFTKQGGLFCVPAHTWDCLGADQITLDMTVPHTCLGAFSRIALEDPRGIRSENPTHSMVVFGDKEKASAFVANEPFITSPTAPDSCYGKLCTQGGYVLLAGVGQNRNTYLHCVGEMLQLPDRMGDTPRKFTVRRPNGQIIERPFYFYRCQLVRDISTLFPRYEIPFRYHSCITDGFLGNAPTQLCDAAGMKDTVALIVKNSNGEDPLSLSNIPPARFCNR